MKKMISILIILSLSLAALYGCGNSESANTEDSSNIASNVSDESSQADNLEDTAQINITFWTMNTIPKDIELVEEAINEITREKINTEIDLTIVDMGSYAQQVNLIITSGEKLDLMVTLPGESAHFNAMTSQNQLLPLNDLINEYAPELLETVPASWLSGTKINGELYSVTSYGDKATPLCFVCRTDILEQTGIDPSTLKTADKFTELFSKVKEVSPEIIPLWGAMTIPYMIDNSGNFVAYDGLGESTNSIISILPENGSTITDLYETELYESTVRWFNDWYEAGYIDRDAATKDTPQESDVQAGTTFGYFKMVGGGEAGATTVSQSVGYDMTVIQLADAVIDTVSVRKFTWAVPQSATEPEAAVKFLNLLYTDEKIVNLLTWGIEGTHYQTLEDGTIDFIDGEDASTCGYYIGDFSSIIGNGFLAKVRSGQDPNYRQKTLELNEKAKVSEFLGFGIDNSSVTNTLTALTNVVSEFGKALAAGVEGPDTIPEFVDKLKAADVDTYVAAMQEQLDSWIENNK